MIPLEIVAAVVVVVIACWAAVRDHMEIRMIQRELLVTMERVARQFSKESVDAAWTDAAKFKQLLWLAYGATSEFAHTPNRESKAAHLRRAFETMQVLVTSIATDLMMLIVYTRRVITSRRQIRSAPGWGLLRFATWTFSKRTVQEVLQPVISDLQIEYNEALAAGQRHRARWIRIRGYGRFWSHVFALGPANLIRLLEVIWRFVS